MPRRTGALSSPRIPDRPDLLRGEDLPPPPRQVRSLERRNRVEDAALELFGTHGYEATTIEDIARAADIPVGGFYHHFRSKRQLLLSLMHDLLVALSNVTLEPRAATHPRAIIRDLLVRGFERDLRYLGAYRAWHEAVLADRELASKQELIHGWTTARVAAAFRRLQQLPSARADVDVDALARVMDSIFWSLLARAAHTRDKELDRAVDATTHLIYHALFVDR
jgi:AcrR family transcriptional regulator